MTLRLLQTRRRTISCSRPVGSLQVKSFCSLQPLILTKSKIKSYAKFSLTVHWPPGVQKLFFKSRLFQPFFWAEEKHQHTNWCGCLWLIFLAYVDLFKREKTLSVAYDSWKIISFPRRREKVFLFSMLASVNGKEFVHGLVKSFTVAVSSHIFKGSLNGLILLLYRVFQN